MALRRRLSIKTNWKNKNKEKKNDSGEREIEDYSEKSSVTQKQLCHHIGESY